MTPCKYHCIYERLYKNNISDKISLSFKICSYRYRDPRLTGAKDNPIAGISNNMYDVMEDNFDETASTADLVLEKSPIQ